MHAPLGLAGRAGERAAGKLNDQLPRPQPCHECSSMGWRAPRRLASGAPARYPPPPPVSPTAPLLTPLICRQSFAIQAARPARANAARCPSSSSQPLLHWWRRGWQARQWRWRRRRRQRWQTRPRRPSRRRRAWRRLGSRVRGQPGAAGRPADHEHPERPQHQARPGQQRPLPRCCAGRSCLACPVHVRPCARPGCLDELHSPVVCTFSKFYKCTPLILAL